MLRVIGRLNHMLGDAPAELERPARTSGLRLRRGDSGRRFDLLAGLAADAHLWIELDDAIGALVHRRDRADADARRVGAVVAARHLEHAPRVGERALLDILDPGPIDA